METSKPWSVSATLRGFYDDNFVSAPNLATDLAGNKLKMDTFGIEIKPTVAVNLPMEQTYVGASAAYSYKYYEAPHDSDSAVEANLKVDHRFSERYKAALDESLVWTRQPELLQGAGLAQTVFRRTSDVFRNRAQIEGQAQVTERIGVALGYENTYYNFLDTDVPGSLSALLDRIENLIRIDGRYLVQPDLTAVAGYQLGLVNYTGDQALASLPPGQPIPAGAPTSEDRNNLSHYFYVGADYKLTTQLTASGRIGLQYTDYVNVDETTVNPYLEAILTYTYNPGSYVQAGIRHTRNATDVSGFALTASELVLDQESTTLYASVTHRITPRVTGNALAQYQRSTYNGGTFNNDVDNYFSLGLNLQYTITPHVSAEAGYNFDRLDSDLGSHARSFTRNRVYIGVRGVL